MTNIVLFGPPGAGKGTQSEKLIQAYQLKHISPGELLREHVRTNTILGQEVAEYINSGKLAPQELVMNIVMEELIAHKEGAGFLFDGFPRTVFQAESLDKALAEHQLQIDAAIVLEVPEQELQQRIQERAKIAGRADDQDHTKVATRMRIYHEETLPVTAYYEEKVRLFRIDGVGSVEHIFSHIKASINQILSSK